MVEWPNTMLCAVYWGLYYPVIMIIIRIPMNQWVQWNIMKRFLFPLLTWSVWLKKPHWHRLRTSIRRGGSLFVIAGFFSMRKKELPMACGRRVTAKKKDMWLGGKVTKHDTTCEVHWRCNSTCGICVLFGTWFWYLGMMLKHHFYVTVYIYIYYTYKDILIFQLLMKSPWEGMVIT